MLSAMLRNKFIALTATIFLLATCCETTKSQTKNFTPPPPPKIPVSQLKQNTIGQPNTQPAVSEPLINQSDWQSPPPQNKSASNQTQIQNLSNQLTVLKTMYDTPQDRLEEICAQKTSAEIQQIKSNEYLRRETARNLLKNQQLPQALTNQVADVIQSEEEFDKRLEAIRVKKVRAENLVKTRRAVLGYLHNVGRGMSNTFANAPAMTPMPMTQPSLLAPMPALSMPQHYVINGQGGTVMTNGSNTCAYGPAFNNY